MKIKAKVILIAIAVAMGSVLAVGQTTAPPARFVYVSAVDGDDANTCSRTSPCREVTRGLEAVSTGGIVTILTSGEYEPFTISKSVSVSAAPGALPIISATEGTAIRVPASTSTLTIRLSGLTVEAGGSMVRGISVSPDVEIRSFQMDNCIVRGGLAGATFSGPGSYSIKSSKFHGAVTNLEFFSSTGGVNASVEDTQVTNGGPFLVGRNANVTVRGGVVSHANGFFAHGTGARLFIENCVVTSNNGDGIFAFDSAFVRISNSTISFNEGYGIRVSGANVKTYGNNRLFSNTSGETSGAVAVLPEK